MKVLKNTIEVEGKLKLQKQEQQPLDGKCIPPNTIYEAQITSNQVNYQEEISINSVKTDFKHRFNNHTSSLNLEHYENDMELFTEYWTIKQNPFTSNAIWKIIRKCSIQHLSTQPKKIICGSMKS